MEITLNDISRRIKEIADERGYTPYALAEKVPQVVQSTVYNALSGTKSMKVETLLYICDALEISPKDFFDFGGEVEYHLFYYCQDFGKYYRLSGCRFSML